MSDLAKRLRQYIPDDISMAGVRALIREAIAEIERLQDALAAYPCSKRIELAVAAEREACAKFVEEALWKDPDDAAEIAAGIRARGDLTCTIRSSSPT